jgi:hypothetical protein
MRRAALIYPEFSPHLPRGNVGGRDFGYPCLVRWDAKRTREVGCEGPVMERYGGHEAIRGNAVANFSRDISRRRGVAEAQEFAR